MKSVSPLGRPVKTLRACCGICLKIATWAPARTFLYTWVERAKTRATNATCRVACRVAKAPERAIGPATARQSARIKVYVNMIQSLPPFVVLQSSVFVFPFPHLFSVRIRVHGSCVWLESRREFMC